MTQRPASKKHGSARGPGGHPSQPKILYETHKAPWENDGLPYGGSVSQGIEFCKQ